MQDPASDLLNSTEPTQNNVTTSSSQQRARWIVVIALVSLLGIGLVMRGFIWIRGRQAADSTDPTLEKVALQSTDLNSSFSYIPEHTNVTPQAKTAPAKISELGNFSLFDQAQPFSTAQKARLEAAQFVIIPNHDRFFEMDPATPVTRTDDWTKLYEQIGGGPIWGRTQANSVFVSTDFVLHVFHRLLEKELEYMEKNSFYSILSDLTASLYTKSIAGYQASSDPAEKASFARLSAFFAVPKVMLETAAVDLQAQGAEANNDKIETMLVNLNKLEGEMSDSSFQAASQELNRIIEAQQVTPSALFGAAQESVGLQFAEDYTQYQPRGHYNKDSVLRTYFRVMMWYGRANFLAKSPELTRDALHMTQFFQDSTLADEWRKLYNPISFLVGKSDDLNWLDYAGVVTLPPKSISAAEVTDAQSQLKSLHGPEIMGSIVAGDAVGGMSKADLQAATKGFRLFGQRAVADAEIFTTLTQGQELPDTTTGESLPSNTTSLFVMQTLGIPAAQPLVQQWITDQAPRSTHILANRQTELQTKFDAFDEAHWTQNVYWSWLYAIKALGMTSKELATGYPLFMQNQWWQQKNLQTALGTWTELKHDTLLYAKQSYAEMGAGGDGDIPPVPHGYVEPNITLFDRVIALQKMKVAGLAAYGLTDGVFEWRNKQFLETMEFFRQLAVKELQNETITDDEFEQLRLAPGGLMQILAVLPGEEQLESAARAAVVADVHTDAVKGQILYEATGIPDYVYVIVNDNYGPRITKGLVYRHYEFTQPLASRQTDEQWQAKVYQGAAVLPTLASWAESLRP